METTQVNAALPLDAPRMVELKDRNQDFRLFFRPITAADWKKFFESVVVESETINGNSVQSVEWNAGLVELVMATLNKATGYKTRDGRELQEATEDWRNKIPIGHRLQAGNILQRVEQQKDEGPLVFDPEAETVTLKAMWGTEADGMREYSGLVHRFKPATIEQQKRVFRARSQSIVVGGSRTGKTIYANRRDVLLGIYDENIVGVDGYSVRGDNFTDLDQVRLQMDASHKVMAAEALFALPE
jgi:hypothetical protein